MTGLSLAQRIEYVFEAYAEYDVPIPPGSRLARMRRAFVDDDHALKRFVPPDDEHFRVAQEALRDVLVLDAVFRGLSSVRMAMKQRHDLMRVLLEDAVVPEARSKKSAGRDLQAELLTAVTCVRGGMIDVAHDEPDVQATVGKKRWAIAVKRVKSAARLDENLRDAADQVERSRLDGVIVLDISQAFNERSTPLLAPSVKAFENAQSRRIRGIIRANEASIFRRTREKSIGLVYVFDSQIRQTPETGWALTTIHMDVVTANDLASKLTVRRFHQAFSKGIDSLGDAQPLEQGGHGI